MEQRLTLITLGVADMGRSLDFYENGMGWKRSPKSTADMIMFELGSISLALYPVAELAKDVTIAHRPTEFSGITIAHNVGSEKEVNEIFADIESIGGRVVKSPEKVFWGGYGGYFADPDGYIFEVAYNPFWPLDQ